MTPKNPFADPEHPIDYGISGKDVPEQKGATKDEKEGKNKPEPSPAPIQHATNYNDLIFEKEVLRGENSFKKLWQYDGSLERIKKNNYTRHPKAHEAFGLIIDGVEKRLSGDLEAVFNDMGKGSGEWLSLAFERKGNILLAYIEPRNLDYFANPPSGKKWSGYHKRDDFTFRYVLEFDVGNVGNYWQELKAFDDKFVRFITGRSFEDLPEKLRKGPEKIRVSIPTGGDFWPVSIGGTGEYKSSYKFNIGCYYTKAASRGVREK